MAKEYIERKAVLDYIDHMPSELTRDGRRMIRRIRLTEYISDSIPAADVAPVRHGRWIDMGDFISCSVCNATRMKEFLSDYGVARRLDARTNYCPNCGAKMDIPAEEGE